MYIKNNKIKLANHIDEVPVNELEIADQLMLIEMIEYDSYSYSLRESIEGVTSMSLVEISHDDIYLFTCSQNYSDYLIEEEFDEKKKICNKVYVNSGLKSKEFYRVYFRTYKNKLMLIYEESRSYFHFEENDIDRGKNYALVRKAIHEKLFENETFNSVSPGNVVCESDDDIYAAQYFPIMMNDDKYLVLTTYNLLNFKNRQWSVSQSVEFFNRNSREVLTMREVDYDYFVEEIKKQKCYKDIDFSLLDEINNVAKYDIEQYLGENEKQRSKSIVNLYFQFKPLNILKLTKMFDPMWVNLEMNLKLYPEQIKDSEFHCYRWAYINDKLFDIHCYENEDEKLVEKVKRQMRIANKLEEHKNAQDGISPYDGLLYKDGQLLEDQMKKCNHHKDDEIVVAGYTNERKQYWVNIDGYYLPAIDNNKEDKKIIEDYHERLVVMNELVQSAKLM